MLKITVWLVPVSCVIEHLNPITIYRSKTITVSNMSHDLDVFSQGIPPPVQPIAGIRSVGCLLQTTQEQKQVARYTLTCYYNRNEKQILFKVKRNLIKRKKKKTRQTALPSVHNVLELQPPHPG